MWCGKVVWKVSAVRLRNVLNRMILYGLYYVLCKVKEKNTKSNLQLGSEINNNLYIFVFFSQNQTQTFKENYSSFVFCFSCCSTSFIFNMKWVCPLPSLPPRSLPLTHTHTLWQTAFVIVMSHCPGFLQLPECLMSHRLCLFGRWFNQFARKMNCDSPVSSVTKDN